MLSNKELLKQWKQHKTKSERGLAEQHERAEVAHAFYAGDRMYYTASVNDKGRKSMVVFNRVMPFVDAITGFMIQLRRKPEFYARVQDNQMQELYSEFANGVVDYIRSNANFDHIESRQDKEMVITGYGAVDTNISYENNPDGDVAAEVISSRDVFWDPEARAPNIMDARWVFRRKMYSKGEAMKRFDDAEPGDFNEAPRDQAYEYNPYGGSYDKIAVDDGDEDDMVEVNYYQYWQLEKYYRIENPLIELAEINPALAEQLYRYMQELAEKYEEEDVTADLFSFDADSEYLTVNQKAKNDLRKLFIFFDVEAYGIQIDYVEHLRKCYYTAVLTDKKVFKHFKSPDQQGFTIKFKTANFDEKNKSWFGLVQQLQEPAKYSNKALTEILFVIANNSKGGVLYEKSAVDNPARFEQTYASTRAAIMVEDGALSGGKIQPKAQAALPNGYESVYGISQQALGEVSGVNKEFLGSAENRGVSALFEENRVDRVVTTLANYFDAISLYQKENARLLLTFVRILAENSQGRLIRIIGEDGAAIFTELSEDKMAAEYDVAIQEAPLTKQQKEKTAEIMIGMAEKLQLSGVNIYPVVIEYLPLTAKQKAQLREAMNPEQRQPSPEEIALAQEMQQLSIESARAQLQKTVAETQNTLAQSAHNEAKVQEALSNADQNRAETTRTLQEAEQKDLENNILATAPISGVNITV